MTYYCIVGLGISGIACAQYCARENISFGVTDDREKPPAIDELKAISVAFDCELGEFSKSMMEKATHIIVSPGVSLREPLLQAAKKAGKEIIGDVELFANIAKCPVIAITGSNGKSTVTTVLGEMAKASKKRVVVAGNIGESVLDSLATKNLPDIYILELSSFQLERTFSLKARAATVLNICEDHMDRYDSLIDYVNAKQIVYQGAHVAVYNRNDPLTIPIQNTLEKISFGLDEPEEGHYGVREHRGYMYLAKGSRCLMKTKKLFLEGNHHIENALAALALGEVAGFDLNEMTDVLCKFKGIEHRCQMLRKLQGITWYNDSKGTNVGATKAAIETVASKSRGKIVLIAGGLGKGADFTPLKSLIKHHVRCLILIGEATEQLATIMHEVTSIKKVDSMQQAVGEAEMVAVRGDSILLSPACSSFDMFDNFEHRGDVFAQFVKEL